MLLFIKSVLTLGYGISGYSPDLSKLYGSNLRNRSHSLLTNTFSTSRLRMDETSLGEFLDRM